MSLHAAAELVADRIRRSGYVEIIAHHDADGIAAGSILAHALARTGLRFRLRIRGDITPKDLDGEHAYLLCDIGAGMEDLPKDTMVIDHHEVYFPGEYQVNPRLAGIDGDRECPAAGAAYVVAGKFGDNRDLAGLAILGMIGDRQELSGMNLEIFNEGVANGIITPARGLRFPGRNLPEQLALAVNPVIEGVSGDPGAARNVASAQGADGKADVKAVQSFCVLSAISAHTAACVEAIYGDTYGLEREVIQDAHSLAAVIDACGKTGHGDLGASLCLRYSRDADAAWETTRNHRLSVIAAFRSIAGTDAPSGIYEIEDATLASDVADALSCRSSPGTPIAVIARSASACRVSARCPEKTSLDLGAVIRRISQSCGGSGGGHRIRAGATIPCDRIGDFKKGWTEAMAA